MQNVLILNIIPSDANSKPLHAVKEGDTRLYCEQLAITTEGGQYLLHGTRGKHVLEHGDVIACGTCLFSVSLQAKAAARIAFNEPRAPTQTLSEQWQQAGLDPFMSEHRLSPLNNTPTPSSIAPSQDPLSFLQGESPSAHTKTGLTLSAPSSPMQEFIDVPSLTAPAANMHTATHISQAKQYQPLASTPTASASSQAPIDQIDDLYRESQSQPFNALDPLHDPSTQTADEQQHIKELNHLINQ